MKTQKKAPLISVIIPTRNRESDLKKLLKSIRASSYANIEVVIINNGDPLVDIHLLTNEKLVHNKTNEGLAAARNKGANHAKGEFIFFVDDDNVIDTHMLSELANFLIKHDALVAVSPQMYYLSSPEKMWFMGAKMNLWTTKPYFYKQSDSGVTSDLFTVEILHNCFMVKKSAGEAVSWFDKKLFMNGTEYDLLQRIKRKMPQTYSAIALKSSCWHNVPLISTDIIRSMGFENPKRAYYFQRNRGVFVYRYGSILQRVTVAIIFYPFFTLMYAALFLVKMRFNLLHEHISGTKDGYISLFRPL